LWQSWAVYELFHRFAERYDLHTPPDHYQHDHAFVLEMAAAFGSECRLLDVGCGTGVLLEKALRAGVLAKGIDASAAMVNVARSRVGETAVGLRRMQEIDDECSYDLVVALSWTLNYSAGRDDLRDVLRRMHRALRPGGRVLLQVAHAKNVDGLLMEDREPGPSGVQDDVGFKYRFVSLTHDGSEMRAEYEYSCRSTDERLREDHLLHVTDAYAVAVWVREAGFAAVEIYDSWRRDPFQHSASPLVTGAKGREQ
jgi:SAM-dependent methyltransferase